MNGPTSPPIAPARSRWWLVAAAIVLCGAFGVRYAYYYGYCWTGDEAITVEVVGRMRSTGDWDTNWAKANLSSDLRYDQYNFSSQLYATYFFYRAIKLVPPTLSWRSTDHGLPVYRMFSVLLATLAVGVTLWIGFRAGGAAVGIGAALLAALATQLVQDAHYVRPEAFVTALTVIAVALCWPGKKLSVAAVLVASLVIGVLIACKVSMLLLAPLPLVPVVAHWRSSRARWWAVAAIGPGILAGFAAGVPGALVHPAQFLNGVHHLMAQYSGGHPPHGHPNNAMVGDLLARFFVATLGWPLLILAGVGVGVLVWRRRWVELALLALPVALFMGYFSTRTVFFERNVSHILPLLFVLAALGAAALGPRLAALLRAPVWLIAAVIVALMVATPAVLTAKFIGAELSGDASRERSRIEQGLRDQHPEAVWLDTALMMPDQLQAVALKLQSGPAPVLLCVCDYHDEWTSATMRQFAAHYVSRQIGDYPGTFAAIPTSTLITYHSPSYHYYLVTGLRAP